MFEWVELPTRTCFVHYIQGGVYQLTDWSPTWPTFTCSKPKYTEYSPSKVYVILKTDALCTAISFTRINKMRNLHNPVPINKKIRRLQIAMNNYRRTVVQIIHSTCLKHQLSKQNIMHWSWKFPPI